MPPKSIPLCMRVVPMRVRIPKGEVMGPLHGRPNPDGETPGGGLERGITRLSDVQAGSASTRAIGTNRVTASHRPRGSRSTDFRPGPRIPQRGGGRPYESRDARCSGCVAQKVWGRAAVRLRIPAFRFCSASLEARSGAP